MRLFAFLGALSLSACSLVTSLDGLRGDALVGDGGSDAATAADAPFDGDSAVDSGPPVVGTLGFVAHWATNGSATSIAARPNGGWFVGGAFQNSLISVVPFGGYSLPKSQSTDIFVAALDANGNPTALATFGGTSYDGIDAIATDANGDLYVAGHTDGLTLGATAVPLGIFIAKFDGKNLAKAPLWVTPFASDLAGLCSSCLKVAGSSVVAYGVVGSADYPTATLTYGSGKVVTTNGSGDTFLARLDAASGAVTSMLQAGSVKNDSADGLAVDAAGDAYITGSFGAAPKVGQLFGANVPAIVGTTYNLVVARVAANGAVAWAKSYGDPASSPVRGAGIAVDGSGRIAVGATISGGVDFGLGPIAGTNGGGAVFVLNGATRATLFQQSIGGPATDDVRNVAFDPWGHLIVTGSYGPSATIGTSALPPSGGPSLYVAKFSPTYTLEWTRAGVPRTADGGFAGLASTLPYLLAVAPAGAIAIAGGLFNLTDFGAGPIGRFSTVANAPDALVVGYQP